MPSLPQNFENQPLTNRILALWQTTIKTRPPKMKNRARNVTAAEEHRHGWLPIPIW